MQVMTLVPTNYCQLQRNNKVLLMLASPNQWDILQILTSKIPLQEFRMLLFSDSLQAPEGPFWGGDEAQGISPIQGDVNVEVRS